MPKIAHLFDETVDLLDEPTVPGNTQSASANTGKPLNCILMDDSDFDRKHIRRIADKSRYDLNLVETGSIEETRNRLAHRSADILLADYRVPDGNGITFAGDLLKAGKNAPQVIVVTGESDPTSAIEAIRAGAADYLPKADITLDLFDGAIENAIRARGRATQPEEMQRDEAVEALKSLQDLTLTRSNEIKAATLPLLALGWQVSQGKMITGKKRDDLTANMKDLAHRIPEMLDDLVIASACGTEIGPEMPVDLAAIVRDIVGNDVANNGKPRAKIECGPLPILTLCPKHVRLLLECLIGASVSSCKPGCKPEIKFSAARDPSGNPIICLQDNGVALEARKQTLGTQIASLAVPSDNGDPFIWSLCQRIAETLGAALKIRPGPESLTTIMIRFDKACLT